MPATLSTDEIRKGLIVVMLDLASQRDQHGTILPEPAARLKRGTEILGSPDALAQLAREMGRHAESVEKSAQFDEGKHKRGQPGNAGQFGSGGGGSSTSDSKPDAKDSVDSKDSKPAESKPQGKEGGTEKLDAKPASESAPEKKPTGATNSHALHEKTHAAIADVHATGKKHEHEALASVAEHIRQETGKDISPEEVSKRLLEAFDKAEITINFRPGQKLPNGKSMADSLHEDPHYRSIFETGITSVGENVDTESYLGARDKFEREKISQHAGDVPPAERPKYAAVNWGNDPGAFGHLYGHGVFVLNKEALAGRMSLAPGNTSWTKSHEGASGEAPANALARSQSALHAAGLTSGQPHGTYGPAAYTEVQVWGGMPINKDTIKEIRLKKPKLWQLKHKKANAKIEALAKKIGVPVRYY